MTGKVWQKIKNEYIRGGTSYRKLSDKYGVSFATIRKIAAREHWVELKDKAGAMRDTKLAESIASREAERAGRLYQAAEDLLTRIADLIGAGDVPMTSQDANFLSSSLERLRRTMDVKSARDLEEQDARIAKLRKEATIEERSSEIRVVLSDDLTDYSE